jgi:hypothetical protein
MKVACALLWLGCWGLGALFGQSILNNGNGIAPTLTLFVAGLLFGGIAFSNDTDTRAHPAFQPSNEKAAEFHNNEFHDGIRIEPEPTNAPAPKGCRDSMCGGPWTPYDGLFAAEDIADMAERIRTGHAPRKGEGSKEYWYRMWREDPAWTAAHNSAYPDPRPKAKKKEYRTKDGFKTDAEQRAYDALGEELEREKAKERRQAQNRSSVDDELQSFIKEAKAGKWNKSKIVREGAKRFHPDKHGDDPAYTRAMQQVVAFAKGW